jgi:hypothetical protein
MRNRGRHGALRVRKYGGQIEQRLSEVICQPPVVDRHLYFDPSREFFKGLI